MLDKIAVLSGNRSADRVHVRCGIGSILGHAPQLHAALK
jgi:hypothetical protein